MPGLIVAETSDLFDPVTKLWVGVTDLLGREQQVVSSGTPLSKVAARVTEARANPIALNNVCRGAVGGAGIDGSSTALTVDAATAASCPQTGIFPIRIEEEDMMVTAGAGTVNFTVTRNINSNGGAAAAHAAGVAIQCGPLSFTFPANLSPSHGDVAANRKIYPAPNAVQASTTGVWTIPEILWQPFPAAMWENQSSVTIQVSDSSTIYSQRLNRVLNDAGALISGLPQAHMEFNGSTLDMLHNTANVTQLHMLVDEGDGWRLPCVGAISNWGSPAGQWVSLNFGSRKTRRICLYGDGNPTGAQGYFGAFAINTKDSLAADSKAAYPTCAIFGDSFLQLYNTFGVGGFCAELAHKLGLHVQNWNIRGGTGYLINGGTGGADGYTRLQNELARWSPDVLMVCLGLNDASNDPTTLTTIYNFYAYARRQLPSSLFLVIGAIRSKESDGTGRNILNAKILSSLQAAGGPWVFVNPNGSTGGQANWYASNNTSGELVPDSWITGSGRVGATSGIGNRDLFVGTDDSHTTLIGTDYFANRAYSSFVNGLSSLVGYRL